MKKKVLKSVALVLTLILFSCGETYEQLPDNFCGKYFNRGPGGETLDNYVKINKDGSWSWEKTDGTKNAYGKYMAKHMGEWGFGPDSWNILFSIEGGELSAYFDTDQVIFYHDKNNVTGERNYYRLNGSMPTTGVSTDFFKK